MDKIYKMHISFVKHTIPILLALLIAVNALLPTILYAEAAGTMSVMGTNFALGSPILNSGAVSNDWNPHETIVWGIFLSNFCQPFVDDYESAFNLGSGFGSKGSGTKALSFGSGNDIANNKTIQDLTTYAIRNQTASARRINVSYNSLLNGEIVADSAFGTGSSSSGIVPPSASPSASPSPSATPTPTATPTPSAAPQASSSPYSDTEYKPTIRPAVLRDLFVDNNIGDEGDENVLDTTWAAFTPGYGASTGNWVDKLKVAGLSAISFTDVQVYSTIYLIMEADNYQPMVGVNLANLPTFCVTGVNNNWETVFDFRDGYDVQVISAAIASALSGDYKKEVEEFFSSSTFNEELWLDGYGNITIKSGDRYIVVIPASANQYLTNSPSINLVNSLIFNTSNASNDTASLTLRAGQDAYSQTLGDKFSSALAKGVSGTVKLLTFGMSGYYQEKDVYERAYSGSLAFTNGSSGLKRGGCVLYYDTDTIVVDKAKTAGYLKEYAEGSYSDKPVAEVEAGIGKFHVDYGEILETIYSLDIADSTNTYQFKIEPVNMSSNFFDGITEDKNKTLIKNAVEVGSSLINVLDSSGKPDRLTYILDYQTGEEIPLFGKSIIVPVQLDDGIEDNGKYNQWAVYRAFHNYLYKVYNGEITQTTLGVPDKSVLEAAFTEEKPFDVSRRLIFNTPSNDNSTFSELAQGFISTYNNLFTITKPAQVKHISASGAWTNQSGPLDMLALKDVDGLDGSITPNYTMKNNANLLGIDDLDNVELAKFTFGRLAKVYYTSDVLAEVCNVLGVRDGTDFGVFAANIYLTYIDWYGLVKNELDGTFSSDINMNLFDSNQVINDISNITKTVMSKEEKQQQVLDYSYLMLHPTEGREYRSQIAMSNLADTIYEQYQRIVYGAASSYSYANYTTRNNTGFLSVENYSENFMTSWFMSHYVTFAIYLIAGGVILVVLISVLKRRKLTWALLGIFVVINVVLILPSTGEIVPYIGNKVVQSLFQDKMTYWSLSEQITNAKMESDASSDQLSQSIFSSKLSVDEQKQVMSLTKQVKALYKDRYLSVRQDISNKVTSTEKSNFDEIQSLTSARWLLPMIIRQFTADDGSANYVYTPLGDKLDNASNMYWFYNWDDAKFVKTVAAKSEGITPTKYDKTDGINTEAGRTLIWPGFTELETMQSLGNGVDRSTYRSEAYKNNIGKLPHTFFYIIDRDGIVPTNIKDISTDKKTFDAWAQEFDIGIQNSIDVADMRMASDDIQTTAQAYDPSDRSTVNQVYGFLWNTESTLHYFYESIKDTFESSRTLGAIIGEIQGKYDKDTDGIEHRTSFMHSDTNYGIRDINDLECLFNNVIPYMYSVQIGAAGYDGTSGVFGTEKIVDYTVYNKNLVSWLFRSNWVTKIVENKTYNSSGKISYYNDAGDRVNARVDNMLLPWCYTAAGREMVFSEAQMLAMNLNESDLSLVELKCLEVNKETEKAWTLLLNYASAKGITKEVLLRQMALNSTMIFNDEFSPVGFTNAKYSLYPTSLNLRSISFDSVMCMLMLNVTHNSSYVYGDTMEVLIDNADILTAALLLLIAALCVWVIPGIRCVTMGLLFYLGYFAVMRALFRGNREKVQVSCGYLASHIIYLIVNIAYLMCFKFMMAVTTSDEVLSVSSMEVNSGNPVWCLLLVLVMNVLFIWASIKMINFCIKNYKDMGMAAIKGTVEIIGSSFSTGFDKLINKLGDNSSDTSSSSQSGIHGDPAQAKKGLKRKGGDEYDYDMPLGGSGSSSGSSSGAGSSGAGSTTADTSDGYDTAQPVDVPPSHDSGGSSSIDEKIQRGKQASSIDPSQFSTTGEVDRAINREETELRRAEDKVKSGDSSARDIIRQHEANLSVLNRHREGLEKQEDKKSK